MSGEILYLGAVAEMSLQSFSQIWFVVIYVLLHKMYNNVPPGCHHIVALWQLLNLGTGWDKIALWSHCEQ